MDKAIGHHRSFFWKKIREFLACERELIDTRNSLVRFENPILSTLQNELSFSMIDEGKPIPI